MHTGDARSYLQRGRQPAGEKALAHAGFADNSRDAGKPALSQWPHRHSQYSQFRFTADKLSARGRQAGLFLPLLQLEDRLLPLESFEASRAKWDQRAIS